MRVMQRLPRLDDISIFYKFLIAPLFSAILLLVVAGLGSRGLQDAATRSDMIVATEMSSAVALAGLSASIQQVQATLSDALVDMGAGTPDAMAKAKPGIVAEVNRIAAAFKVQAQQPGLSEEERQAIGKVIESLSTYAGTIDVVASMLEIDFASGVGMLTPFRSNFAEMKARIATLVETRVGRARANAGAVADDAHRFGQLFIWIGVTGVVILAAASVALARSSRRSIAAIAGATERLAREDLTVDVGSLARRDELGGIVEALRVFRGQIERARAAEAEQQDLRRRAEADRVAALRSTADRFEADLGSALTGANRMADDIAVIASALLSLAEDNARSSTDTSGASERVLQNVQTVASAIEELAASTQEIAQQAQGSNTRAGDGAERAMDAVARVRGLVEAVQRIDMVVKLIGEVASQTNLLALNATIEAARAGEAGKGFAVVAGEVKNLAAQATKATEEVRSLVLGIQAATGEAAGEIERVHGLMQEIRATTTSIAAAIEEQNSATGEIARSVNAAADDVGRLRQGALDAATAAEKSGTGARDLHRSVDGLRHRFGEVQRGTSAFLDRLRA